MGRSGPTADAAIQLDQALALRIKGKPWTMTGGCEKSGLVADSSE